MFSLAMHPLIQVNGACYQPNTVKNHCDVAVKSYYQKKASSGATCDFNGATCDFNGAAMISNTPPTTASSCLSGSSYASVYPAEWESLQSTVNRSQPCPLFHSPLEAKSLMFLQRSMF